jgi:hypothetical protein
VRENGSGKADAEPSQHGNVTRGVGVQDVGSAVGQIRELDSRNKYTIYLRREMRPGEPQGSFVVLWLLLIRKADGGMMTSATGQRRE